MIRGNCSQPDVFSYSNPKIVPQYLSQNLARVMKRAMRNHATALCPQRQRTVLLSRLLICFVFIRLLKTG
jgi:hypothetical protein